jgi:radical SAM protein with 4Fe4S-binding SPASM domain
MNKSDKIPTETFCIIPWIHLNTWPNGNVYQCCITNYKNNLGNLKQNTLKELWNSDHMKNLRLQFLNGEKPSTCKKCFEQEDNDIVSFRHNANWTFEHHIEPLVSSTNVDGSLDDMKLRYWDFRFSNLCNMKCRMCGGHLSSLWFNDEAELYGNTSEKVPVVNTKDHSIDDMYKILDEQIDNVEEIYFAGGEPLIMDEHYYILEKLIEKKRFNVKLRYNTNLLKVSYKKWNNIDLWKHFELVQVMASLDGFGPRGEYIRKGTKWEVIDNNIRLLVNSPNVQFNVSPTIQLLNIFHLPEFIDYLFSCGLKIDNMHISNVLTDPKWYHINTLDDEYKKQVEENFKNHLDTFSDPYIKRKLEFYYNSIISYMYTGSDRTLSELNEIHQKFLYITNTLDRIRNESFLSVFPELERHYNKVIPI